MVHCSHNSSLKSLPGAAILTVEQTPHIHLATHLSDTLPNEVGEGSSQLEEPLACICSPDPEDHEAEPLLESKLTTKFNHF